MIPRFSRFLAVVLNSYYVIKRKDNIFFCDNNHIEEKVFLFGDRRSLFKDIKQNGEATFFEKNKIKVKKITFGNCIGGCITENDDIYIWGSYEDEEKGDVIYINPIKININEEIRDIQFSYSDIYLLNKKGELKIIRDYRECLRRKEFIFEDFYKCKNSIFFKNEKIIKLSVNKFHLAFVTNKGNVYCSGNNFYGQCAMEPSFKNNFNLNYNFDFANNLNSSIRMMDSSVIQGLNQNGEATADYVESSYSPNGYSVKVRDESISISPHYVNSYNKMHFNKKMDEKNKRMNISPFSSRSMKLTNKNDQNENEHVPAVADNRNEIRIYDEGDHLNHLILKDTFYIFNKNNYVHINKVPFEERTKIVDVSCGLNHTLCLDDKNNVYSFGDDSKIQLGLGESRTNKNSLSGTRWKDQLKLGYSTITKNLANYSFYDRHIQSSPQKILKKMNDHEMVNEIYKINAGSNFSMVHSNDHFGKQLFCFGDNMYFQCGRHIGKHQQTLSTVKLPNNKIKDFSCGDKHCLLNLNDKLYGWGYNNKYQISPI
ncbi:regulator of chromosome condensation [Plasmodium brasilianum]|uniref:Regulator of chromosome condensation n=1 Tax=Plasmodium brasilianum TaxID=5824 RepID=A0ACB9YFJ0_PLABR|nr:regulator of chromosome condensation [Plasmodium brasilianum]